MERDYLMARKPAPEKGSYQKLKDAHDSVPSRGDRDAANKVDRAIDKITPKKPSGGGNSGNGSPHTTPF